MRGAEKEEGEGEGEAGGAPCRAPVPGSVVEMHARSPLLLRVCWAADGGSGELEFSV